MLNRPTNAVTKRAVMLAGAVLAMIAMLVISSPAPNGIFAHDDPVPDDHNVVDHVHYPENGTGMVRDFDSTDPEGSRIEWSLRGLDAADFKISGAGVLTFKESPDFENPTDRVRALLDLNGDTDTEDPGEAAEVAENNDYLITVSATEVWDEVDTSLPAKRTDIHFTVTVVNADDDGKITLQWLQPEVNTPISATLTDPDGGITDSTWTWYTSKVADPEIGTAFHWNEVTDTNLITGANADTASSYTPQGDTVVGTTDSAVDEGKYLRVIVEYTDTHGASKEMNVKSAYPVRAEVSSPGDNGSPDFQIEADTRTVSESLAVEGDVGLPVTATDPDDDTLTYELIPAPDPNAGDAAFFEVDQASGQITVAQELDYDANGTPPDGEYVVIVRATDPSGEVDNITITITAENANEAPVVAGRAELVVMEASGYAEFTAGDGQPSEYIATQPETLDSIATWDLEGADASAFDLGGLFEPRYLNFKAAPDYENPTDANKDNVYEVTIVAKDIDPLGTGVGIGKVNVWVIVHNVEEAGKAVFTEGATGYIDEMLVAQVQDPDDHGGDPGEPYQDVHVQTWQWSKSETETGIFEDIVGETTDRYTPVKADRGNYLRLTVTYTDPFSAADNPGTEAAERVDATGTPPSLRIVSVTTDNAVRLAPGIASAPSFPDGTATVTREVAENTGPGGKVGAPVVASGPDGLVHSLEGTDSKYFNIDSMTAQITVGGDDPDTQDTMEAGTDPELDYDDPAKKKTFRVIVKVVAPDSQTAQVNVTINVTDVNEAPKVTDSDGDAVVSPVAPSYPEAKDGAPNTDPVATYTASDPEGLRVSWDLRGADASLFTINNSGVLSFVNPPDFEDTKDIGGTDTATPDATADDNIYSIYVRAIAARATGDTGPAQAFNFLVNVAVTNVDETGAITLTRLQPEAQNPGNADTDYTTATRAITASLTDPDEENVSVDTWTWEVSTVLEQFLDIDNDDHWTDGVGTAANNAYTPAVGDVGSFLRVSAMYTDDAVTDANDDDTDDGDTVRLMTSYKVQAVDGGFGNGSPDFRDEKVERTVAENIAVGANVGTPVTASVLQTSATDRLTYGLRAFATGDRGATDLAVPSDAADIVDSFNIDQATGQITVAEELSFEDRGPGDARDGIYIVVATVFDPSGLSDTVVVVITAEDRNDNPVLEGRPELTIVEDATDFVGNPTDPSVNYYTVADQDRHASIGSWSLNGEDKALLQLIGTEGRTLVFKTPPDFEIPADADGDNVYKVTIVVIDNNGGRGEYDVCIEVTNTNEDGMVTLLDANGVEVVQPHAHGPLTAELTDPDGGVRDVVWAWLKADTAGGTFAAIMDAGNDPITSRTYTPANDDTGDFLRVTAMYHDSLSAANAQDVDKYSVSGTTDLSVLEGVALGGPPVFSVDGVGVEVAENSPTGTYIGAPLIEATDIEATDPDGTPPDYSIEDVEDGDDAKYFALAMHDHDGDASTGEVNSRQLIVAMPIGGDDPDGEMFHPVDLDHENSDKSTFTIVLKASDPTQSDTITVTITVTNRNEAPSTPMAGTGEAPTTPANNAPMFAAETDTREVAENTAAGTDIGAPVMATDADDDDTLMYTLGGTDAASFTIDPASGQLMTMAALDFEMMPSYTVEVTATDVAGASDTIEVTITVTNVDEPVILGDTDGDGMISKAEVIAAFDDYVEGRQYTKAQIIAIFDLYVDAAAGS